jgi:DNA-binding NtrC family response regulator/pSer/pThr/pTyr-binding forkhead associated (FHA) protein
VHVNGATTLDGTQSGAIDDGVGRVYLVVREGARSQLINLDDGAQVIVGRSSDATVHIEDGKASREHARFERRGDEIRVVDLDSRNGTQWNGEMLRGAGRRVRSGDRVRIGAVEIIVAENAGVVAREQGGRLESALAAMLAESSRPSASPDGATKADGGRAALLRLALSAAELAQISPSLAGAALIEAQAGGDYACLVEAGAADRVVAAMRQLGKSVGIARAPEDGRTVDELWPRTTSAPRRAPAPAVSGVVVADPGMVRVFELVRKVAAAPTTVLILGETGVGKEVVAEQIHRLSARAAGPFIRLNCASLPESLLESELFGHERGAFTGADRRKLGYVEAAAGGTLFLDEIGELALTMQARLLRVLEDHRLTRVGGREEIAVDVRVLAATNRDLEAEVAAGRFRQDLYFRLAAFVVRVPSLRERPSELELLAELFARQQAQRLGIATPSLSVAALDRLRKHSWPGNVRELRNAIEHAVLLAENGVVDAGHLPDSVGRGPTPVGPMKGQIADVERRSILDALDAEGGNQSRAARRLGISRRALLYKMEKYAIKR